MPEEVEELISEEDAAFDEGTIEIDPSTEAELKAMGIEIPGDEVPSTEESEEIAESPEAEAPIVEDPPAEPVVEEEKPLILGKYKSYDDLEAAHQEAQRRISEDGHIRKQYEQAQTAWDLLRQHPDGPRIISEIMSGRPPQPQTPEIPLEDSQQFSEWLGSNLPNNLGTFVQHQNRPMQQKLGQVEQTLNTVLAYLENQAVESKYGDTLGELQPHIEGVMHELGPRAQYFQREDIIRLAKGRMYDALQSEQAAQQQTEQQKHETEQRHREKVLSATVESADNATEVAPKIVDTSKMSAKELEKHLRSQGVKIVHHD
jgi:hypothetical protein